ncbi:unnamed protein product [Brachionus calyciflorus]|uniref:HEAT repeat-containing protein 6 n=1 Tax=Brachionus calyciflorus TaxID=104777 RepID=A0A813RZD1_9BILA|nr:unnamed protein product [Brachionus calyciflorus]
MSKFESSGSDSTQLYDLYKSILIDYKLIKNLSPNSPDGTLNLTFFDNISKIIDKLKNLFSFLTSNANKIFNSNTKQVEFLNFNNDQIVEIIVVIGELIDSAPSEVKNSKEIICIYFKYSDLIVNFAEKSPIKYGHLKTLLNKLISFLLNFASNLINNDLDTLLYELKRAIGSIIYENSTILSDQNIERILSNVSKLRHRVETDYDSIFSDKTLNFQEEKVEILNKFNLITTQIIFNLTLPKKKDSESELIDLEYINDTIKAKCASYLVKILRFNTFNKLNRLRNDQKNSIIDSLNKQFNNRNNRKLSLLYGDEFIVNNCKILSKALQGLENLFLSISNQLNWIVLIGPEFQLGDILAIIKDLSVYGIVTKKSNLDGEKSVKENKLEPSNVDDLLSNEKNKKFNDLNSQSKNDNNETDDEIKIPNEKLNNKKTNNNNGEKGKNSKFGRNNSGKQLHNQSIDSNLFEKNIENNSVQCLREAQVPLVHYKSVLNNFGTDSDVSTDSSLSSSSFNIGKSSAKVRVAAFGALLTIFQKLEKRTVVSYWNSFLEPGSINIIYSVKNDPSPKVRLIAATALSVYLENVRSFFMIAAVDDTSSNLSFQTTQTHPSFLPISYTITTIIRQLHKELFNCLNRESFQLNQIQLLKCLQCLIKSTPYQKLKPGLIYKLILSLNILLDQKSNLITNQSNQRKEKINVCQEILNCLETILLNHHQMAEVHLALGSSLNSTDTFLNDLNSKSSTCSSIMEIDDLTLKLDKINDIKIPNLNQSRIKYFYESNNSNTVSGQMTPNNPVNDLVMNNSKSWLVDFSIQNGSYLKPLSLPCLEIMTLISRHYFDLIKKDLFFDEITKLILENLESISTNLDTQISNQIILKTIKFIEEFARCLATSDLRQMNSIDLNDCCKLWSSLLSSKLLSEYLIDEQRYLLSSSACDCLASIGAPIFELLPYQKRIFCLTNLIHLTKSQSSLIRAASVRALGVYVTFTSLKEDQNFLTDLSVCLLNLISNDSNNLVRQKTAWSMSNLSEVLIENVERVGGVFTEEFNLKIWYRLLDSASSACQRESDKLKSYLVRTLGNLISYISSVDVEIVKNQLDLISVEKSISKAVESLCSCKNVKMLKVKWNLSHAIGVAMKRFSNWSLHFDNPKWLEIFFDTLLELFTQSNNFKVRINACIALMNINSSDINIIRADEKDSIYIKIWTGLIEGFSKLKNENIDANNEIQHKNNLTHQLCKLFTFLCKYLRVEDLEKIMNKCLNNLKLNSMPKNLTNSELNKSLTINELRSYFVNYIKSIYDQIETYKQDVQFYNEALTNLNFLNSKKNSSLDEDCINLLNSVLQKPKQDRSTLATDESESSETENLNTDNENENEIKEYRKKFPFKNVYD